MLLLVLASIPGPSPEIQDISNSNDTVIVGGPAISPIMHGE